MPEGQPATANSTGRLRRLRGWIRRHPLRCCGLGAALAFLVLNLLAFLHAGALTVFVDTRQSTAAPEALTAWERTAIVLAGPQVARPVNARTPEDCALAYSTHVLPGDHALEVWWIPSPARRGVVLLCHGYAASKASQLTSAQVLHELGYSCALLDFRGSGGSAGDPTTLGFHEARDVAIAFAFAQQRAEGGPVVLFGTSMGAAAVLRAVHAEGLSPAGVIVEAPYNRLLDTVRNRFALMGVPSQLSAELLVFWGSVRAGIDGFAHNPADYAASLACPTLVLHGSADQRVAVAEAQEVFDAIPESCPKRFVLLPGVAHETYARVRPVLWREHVRTFLDRW